MLTPSNMLPLGSIAPDFTLLNTQTGEPLSLSEAKGTRGTVIMWICNHCPYVIHLQQALVEFASAYAEQGIATIAISSNDADTYPADNPAAMTVTAQQQNYPFPYLFDESQAVAKAYQAACTPDFYLFDSELACVYRGRFDNSTPSNGEPITGNDLRCAVDNLLQGDPIVADQKPSCGCNIKWR